MHAENEAPKEDEKTEKRNIEDLDIDAFLAGDFLDSDAEAEEGEGESEEEDLSAGSDEEEEEEGAMEAAGSDEEGERLGNSCYRCCWLQLGGVACMETLGCGAAVAVRLV